MQYIIILLLTAGQFVLGDREPPKFPTDRYLEVDELYKYLQKLSKWATGSQFELKVIGNTFIEGKTHENNLYEVKIGSDKDPVLFFDCGIHAREWISSATCFYLIESLAKLFKSSKTDPKNPILKYQWIFLPMMNPDGYDLSHTTDRFQRKNARPFESMNVTKRVSRICRCDSSIEECRGVDLNRNFPSGWGKGNKRFMKTSHLPCEENYRGSHPLSEPETIALDKQVTEYRKRILGAFSIHCYGKEIYHPKGWLRETDPNQIHGERKQHITDFAEHFNKFLNFGVGSVHDLIGPTYLEGGATDDYYFTTQGIEYSYTIELDPHADDREVEFELPPKHILPVGKKMWKAITRMAEKFEDMKEEARRYETRSL